MTKNIYLTFDYEIFLGKDSGTVEKCMLEPTNMLIEEFDKYNIKSTFFVDILFYMRLIKENNTTRVEATKIKNQLKTLVSKGHRIELHLHPHWGDAIYIDGKWTFTYEHYRLDSLSEQEIIKHFRNGVNELNNIAREEISDYKVNAFRAGGLCIQPFKKLKKAFKDTGIVIDSSVAPRLQIKTEAHAYSYVDIQQNKFYKFEDDVCIKDPSGAFIEMPLTIIDKTFFDKLIDKIYKKFFYSRYGNGQGMNFPDVNQKNETLFKRISKKYMEHVTMDSTNIISFKRSMSRLKDRNVVLMCHPKFLSKTQTPQIIKYLTILNTNFKTTNDLKNIE
jgi:hypothetical protein